MKHANVTRNMNIENEPSKFANEVDQPEKRIKRRGVHQKLQMKSKHEGRCPRFIICYRIASFVYKKIFSTISSIVIRMNIKWYITSTRMLDIHGREMIPPKTINRTSIILLTNG
jgi:hypothetical protein